MSMISVLHIKGMALCFISTNERKKSVTPSYDAILIMSFGGPEGMDDVIPFLDNVLRGKNVPEARKLEVAHHYEMFGGISPINDQNRELIALLRAELDAHGVHLPIYWANRNWHPMTDATLRQMEEDGVRRALMFVTSGYSCYSGCRQYREDVIRSRTELGEGAPIVDKIRVFYNHPEFIGVNVEHIQQALAELPEDVRDNATLLFTAHSIPKAMADTSRYEKQLQEACRLVAEQLTWPRWQLVYQSRSGPPHVPWLEPDVGDVLHTLKNDGCPAVVISPLGFTSDHMEVMYDLDVEAREICEELGLPMRRAKAAGNHPRFVAMVRELIQERITPSLPRRALGDLGPSHDVCPEGCCPAMRRPASPAHA